MLKMVEFQGKNDR